MEVIRNTNLETPLIDGNRESMELEHLSVETNADEPFWLKILCFLGGVYPILRENGKCKCNWNTVGWSIGPFIWTSWVISSMIYLIIYSPTFQYFWTALGFFLYLLLLLSLSYTRKRFSDVIVGEEDRLFINNFAKTGLIESAIFGVIISVIKGKFSAVFGVEFTFTMWSFVVITLRCLFLTRTSVIQVRTELLEMVRGTEVEKVQTKLLEISKMIKEASVGYVQVPLSLLFVSAMTQVVDYGISTYKQQYEDKYIFYIHIISVVFLGAAMVTPLWLLTRIEKFYLWTLRELLHRNTVMPRTEQTNLLAKYDTIAPRASIFGIYITRGRIASITIAIFGPIAPKIGIYLYYNLGHPFILPSGNHTVTQAS